MNLASPALAALFLLSACGDPHAIKITIKNFKFDPANATVPLGATVTWKNLDDEAHSVRAAEGQFRSAALDQNESFSFKFDRPGSFQYGCSLHAKMAGIVIVRPQ